MYDIEVSRVDDRKQTNTGPADGGKTRAMIEIPLTPQERSLLLRYGYPFEQIENALKACESSDDIEIVPMDSFELERLIGDVCLSINHIPGGATQDQLLDLCDRLEAAEKHGDAMPDAL